MLKKFASRIFALFMIFAMVALMPGGILTTLAAAGDPPYITITKPSGTIPNCPGGHGKYPCIMQGDPISFQWINGGGALYFYVLVVGLKEGTIPNNGSNERCYDYYQNGDSDSWKNKTGFNGQSLTLDSKISSTMRPNTYVKIYIKGQTGNDSKYFYVHSKNPEIIPGIKTNEKKIEAIRWTKSNEKTTLYTNESMTNEYKTVSGDTEVRCISVFEWTENGTTRWVAMLSVDNKIVFMNPSRLNVEYYVPLSGKRWTTKSTNFYSEITLQKCIEKVEANTEIDIKGKLYVPDTDYKTRCMGVFAWKGYSTAYVNASHLTTSAPKITLIWPSSGSVTSVFGPRNGKPHNGIDIGGGGDIVAAGSGKVTYVYNGCNHTNNSGDTCNSGTGYGMYGNVIEITHPSGSKTFYAHLKKNSITVSVGDAVTQGERIAEMGSSGRSTGVHLHFETIVNNTKVDPLLYLPKRGNYGNTIPRTLSSTSFCPIDLGDLGEYEDYFEYSDDEWEDCNEDYEDYNEYDDIEWEDYGEDYET